MAECTFVLLEGSGKYITKHSMLVGWHDTHGSTVLSSISYVQIKVTFMECYLNQGRVQEMGCEKGLCLNRIKDGSRSFLVMMYTCGIAHAIDMQHFGSDGGAGGGVAGAREGAGAERGGGDGGGGA